MSLIIGGLLLLAAGVLAAKQFTGDSAPTAPNYVPTDAPPAKGKAKAKGAKPKASTPALETALDQAQSLNTFDAWNMLFGLATKANEANLADYARQRMQALDAAQAQAQAAAATAIGGNFGEPWLAQVAVRAVTVAKSCPCQFHWLLAARACLTAGHLRGHAVCRAQFLALGGNPALFGTYEGEVGRGTMVWIINGGRALRLPAGGVANFLRKHPGAHRATRADYIKVQTADGHTLSMLRVLASNYVRKHPGARIVRDGGQNLRLPPTAPPPDQDDGGQDDGSQDDGSQDDGGQDQSPDQG